VTDLTVNPARRAMSAKLGEAFLPSAFIESDKTNPTHLAAHDNLLASANAFRQRMISLSRLPFIAPPL
jgi:hypothetical protein